MSCRRRCQQCGLAGAVLAGFDGHVDDFSELEAASGRLLLGWTGASLTEL